MDDKWKLRIVAGALGLSVLLPTSIAAADTTSGSSTGASVSQPAAHQRFSGQMNQASMTNILNLVQQYAPDTQTQWQSAIDQRNQLMSELKAKMPQKPQLTAAQKQQLQDIMTQVKNGTMTQTQASAQLQSLGLGGNWGMHTNQQSNSNGSNANSQQSQRPQLTAAQKQQLQDIRTQVQNGTLTKEQASTQLQSLGLGGHGGMRNNPQSTSSSASDANGQQSQRPQLTAAQKQQLQSIMTQVKNGTMTQAQASAQMQSLGLPTRAGFGGQNNLMQQLNQAVTSGDTATIQNLLGQLLQQMTQMNQSLANKLAQGTQ